MSKYSRSHCPPQHFFIQNKLILAINDPAFKLVLPELRQSSWNRVLLPDLADDDERERLEFLGDALLHVSVALELYKLYPQGTPHLFTVLRSVMNTNSTFTHYMLKVGAFAKRPIEQPRTSADAFDKVAADAFETLIAAYYFEQGFQAVCTWVSNTLKPLIIVARKAYDEFRAVVRPTQRLEKRLREEADRYLAGKKTRVDTLPEPSHSLRSSHPKDAGCNKWNPTTASTSRDADRAGTGRHSGGKRPANYPSDLLLLDASKSLTRTTNQTWEATGTRQETVAASHPHDSHEGPSSGLGGDDSAVLIVDSMEEDDWIDIDDEIKVKSTPLGLHSLTQAPASVHATVGSSKSRSPSLLARPRHPGTRKSRREALRALQYPHTTTNVTDAQASIADTTGVAGTAQIPRADEEDSRPGAPGSHLSGPIKPNRPGIATKRSRLQLLTRDLSSAYSSPHYSNTQTPQTCRHEVLDVTVSMSTLLHNNGGETAPGSFDNPITVDDGDNDAAMVG